MAKKETEFSKFAQAFREVIDGNKTYKTILTKDLLKMGLTNLDKDYINTKYPTYTDNIGKRHIKDNKGSGLLKYFEGANDLSNLIPDLETEFDEEFRERYCEELQDYNESKIIEFAQVLKIDVHENDIDIVSEAIAEYYASIVIGSATKNRSMPKHPKENQIVDRQNIHYSYSISLDEEKDIRNICKAIINNLDGLKRNVERVNSYKSELVKSPDSESNDMNEYYESHIKSKEKEFNKIYPVFVLQCAALNSKLAPKMYMNKSFAKLISITSFFISDENKEMSIDRFVEKHIQVKVYDLQTYIKYSLKEIDMQ